jgi:hypothetical protein
VIFVEAAPAEEIGFLDYVEHGREIKQLVTEMLGVSPEEAAASATRKNGSTLFVKDDARVPELLASSLGVQPDLRFEPAQPNLYFAEFARGSARFYFLRNPNPQARKTRVILAGEGALEIWDPWTGHITGAQQYARAEGGTTMEVHLPPYGSLLVAMNGAPEAVHVVRTNFPEVHELNGHLTGIAHEAGTYRATLSNGKTAEWTIAGSEIPDILPLGPGWFLKAMGKDKNDKDYTREVHLADLKDWTLVTELHNFSGKGHYLLDFKVDRRYLRPGLQLELDLGDVHDVAEVWINGRKAATLLLLPYRLDATPYLHAGNNHVEVIVANTLRNRMVGDGLAGDPNFIYFRNRMFYLPSGMLGPVRLVPNRAIDLQ